MINSRNVFLTFLFLCVFTSTYAQSEQVKELKGQIDVFFKGLQSGDTLVLKQTLRADALLQTAYFNKEGESVLKTEKLEDFLKAVANKNPEDKWEEKLLDYHINIDGNMAHVWTPYEFYFNSNFSHCGVNSFQLFYNGKKWQIIYLIDTRKREACKK